MRRALQRSLLAPGLTVTPQAWSGSVFAAEGQARFETEWCQASPRGARRGVARSVPLLAQPLRAPRSLRHTAEVSGEVQRFRDLGWTLAVPPTHEVQECIQQWCKERLTFWNARSQTEGDDLGIRLLGLLEGLVNETLEVIDGL